MGAVRWFPSPLILSVSVSHSVSLSSLSVSILSTSLLPCVLLCRLPGLLSDWLPLSGSWFLFFLIALVPPLTPPKLYYRLASMPHTLPDSSGSEPKILGTFTGPMEQTSTPGLVGYRAG